MSSTTSKTASERNDPVQPDLTLEKSGKGVARGAPFPKTDFRHWETRIYKSTYIDDNGAKKLAQHYTVRIGHRGRRVSIPLGLAGKRDAAKKAGQIYMMLIAHGWEPTLAKYRTDAPEQDQEPTDTPPATIGAYITAAAAVAEVTPRTLHDYAAMVRRIAAAVGGIKADPKRFGPKKGGASRWRAKVDALPLACLSMEAIEAWKLAHSKAAKDPTARRRAESTANSTIRQAKALFAPKISSKVAKVLPLPDPLPFHGVEYFKPGSTRYLSKIDPGTLMEAAARDLGADPARSEEWKIFILALFCGLRRREIDTLTWRQVDFSKNILRIEETKHFRPKSADSTGEIDLDPEAAKILQRLKTGNRDGFVIDGDADAKPHSAIVYYRAAKHFDKLTDWLREQGITAGKPLHELRKEAGSLVAKAHGLYGAQRFLRHSSPATTAAHYLDKKERVTPGLGGLLAAPTTTEDDNSTKAS